jgi:hypothetical protein
MGQGATNKRKGSNAEREYAIKFRNLGFSKCKTSRQGSRIHDDAGIDLINLPWNVQVKAGFQKGMNPSKVLNYITEKVPELFMKNAPEQDNINILIHKKSVGQGRKANEFDELVFMSFKDFGKLISMIDYKEWKDNE